MPTGGEAFTLLTTDPSPDVASIHDRQIVVLERLNWSAWLEQTVSSTGLDFSRYEPDEPIRYVKNDAINSAVETLTTLSTEPWTLRRIVSRMGLGSRNPAIVGSA